MTTGNGNSDKNRTVESVVASASAHRQCRHSGQTGPRGLRRLAGEHRSDERRPPGGGLSGGVRLLMAKDPVCGMDVDETTARHATELNGQTYYFCAPGCNRRSRATPG